MSWGQYLFSFRGRINRLRYWQFALISAGFVGAALLILVPYFASTPDNGAADRPPTMFDSTYGISAFAVLMVLLVMFLISGLAIYIKRLHDRNKSGWWVLVFAVLPVVLDAIGQFGATPGDPSGRTSPFSLLGSVISLWALVELGFLRGTVGPNRYGPDPLDHTGSDVAQVFE